jgi:hypothetical protein
MKQEFRLMIQAEVKSQIQSKMAAIQAEMTNLEHKFDNMQEGIRKSA